MQDYEDALLAIAPTGTLWIALLPATKKITKTHRLKQLVPMIC
jgi:hypothetical protein